jgi:hypothetical protein
MKLFSWFNPLWLVQNLFTTSLNPITIGAGIGALGSAVQGKSPFKGALLGGALGGLGSAGGLFGAGGAGAGSGSGLLSGFKGIEAAVPSLGSGGYAALGQNALGPIGGAATGGINFGSIGSNLGGTNLPLGGQGINNLASYANPLTNVAENSIGIGTQGLGGAGINLGNVGGTDLRRLAVNTPLSLGEQFTDMISNPLSGLSTSDKLGLGLKGFDLMNQPQQMIQPVQVAPITRGNPEAVSAPLFNVAPNVGMQQGNEIGLPNLKTTIPLTDEEILRLQQMLQTTGFRGR